MFSLESFKVDLNKVTEDGEVISFDLDDNYFKAIDGPEVKSGAVHVDVSVRKTAGVYELLFHCEGTVSVPCDICLDDMEQPVCTDDRLVARLGEEYSEDDDLVTVERDSGVLDTAWFIYEFIALGLPVRHVHQPGGCNPEMLRLLKEHSADGNSDGEHTHAVDSRWSELEKLKTIIKD